MPVPNTKKITTYFHCGQCLRERPKDVSPADWARLEIGFTPQGIQAWCLRHDANVLHVDFQGQRHPANTTAAPRAEVPSA